MKDALAGYRITERRALLQAVRASETLIDTLHNLSDSGASTDDIIKALIVHADSQRKAFLQIVRDTEKAYKVRRSQPRTQNADKTRLIYSELKKVKARGQSCH